MDEFSALFMDNEEINKTEKRFRGAGKNFLFSREILDTERETLDAELISSMKFSIYVLPPCYRGLH